MIPHLSPDIKLSDLISYNPYVLLLLEHFNIQLPVQDKSIRLVCLDNNLNPELFLTFAHLYNGAMYKLQSPLSHNDIIAIVNYLKNSHKHYSEEIYPNILTTIQQMAGLNNAKEMALVPKFFVDYYNEVTEHFDYENKVVFPYVLELCEQLEHIQHVNFTTQYSVVEYREHHDDIEEKLNDLKNLLIKYLPQGNDQSVRRKLLFQLSELENDLNIHSQIEDLILIPLVAQIESQLKKKDE
jgi:regulator of cell morphogenesis and NO signaling